MEWIAVCIAIIGLWLPSYSWAETIHIISNGDGIVHNTHSYGVDVQGVSWIFFRLKGCNDGYVRLYSGSDFSTAANAFVLFGGWGNDKCEMKPCSGCASRHSQRYPYLNCEEFRPMWVNWTGRLLSVGEGYYVEENTFMFTEEQRDFDVQYLGVGSAWNKTFDWEFEGPAGNFFECVVSSGFSTRTQLTSTTSASLFECVRACQQTRGCKSISYRKSDGSCDLSGERTRSRDIQADSEWQTWLERKMT